MVESVHAEGGKTAALLPVWEPEQEMDRITAKYNDKGYHESLKNLKPREVYEGRGKQILDRPEKIRRGTLQLRRQLNLGNTKCVS